MEIRLAQPFSWPLSNGWVFLLHQGSADRLLVAALPLWTANYATANHDWENRCPSTPQRLTKRVGLRRGSVFPDLS